MRHQRSEVVLFVPCQGIPTSQARLSKEKTAQLSPRLVSLKSCTRSLLLTTRTAAFEKILYLCKLSKRMFSA